MKVFHVSSKTQDEARKEIIQVNGYMKEQGSTIQPTNTMPGDSTYQSLYLPVEVATDIEVGCDYSITLNKVIVAAATNKKVEVK